MPPMAGPIMVPTDHTKGMTVNARAVEFSFSGQYGGRVYSYGHVLVYGPTRRPPSLG